MTTTLLALKELHRTVRQAWQGQPARRAGIDIAMLIGYETRDASAAYDWHGLKRPYKRAPFVVFQYTLDGQGCYEDAGGAHRLAAGDAFTAVVPSNHRYYLPADSRGWTFFWLIIYHPYIVQRMLHVQQRAGAVWSIAAEHLLAVRAAQLFAGVARRHYEDELALERAMFDFLFEYERFGQHRVHPVQERENLLAFVRSQVTENFAKPPAVEQLSARRNMSRSHFTHEFRRKTGLTPAAYMIDLRLDEVTRRLAQTDSNLYAIARATGFADANHLCKVFRRRYRMSPGEYRRQTRG